MGQVTANSFAYFVYPFIFAAEDFDARRVSFTTPGHWPQLDSQHDVWETQRFPNEDLLKHVADYINPPDGKLPTAVYLRLTTKALQSASGLNSRGLWCLQIAKKNLPFSIKSVQLAIFRSGVGFLILNIVPTKLESSTKLSSDINDWFSLLHYFRFISGQRRVSVQTQKRSAPLADSETIVRLRDVQTIEDVITDLLNTGSAIPQEGAWWEDVFVPGQMLPFTALCVKDTKSEEVPELLYRTRHFFHPLQELHISEDDHRKDHPSLLPYAQQQWFTFSLDGGAFFAADAPNTQFFQVDLLQHISGQYFLLFLIALNQRFTLIKLSQKVSESWLSKNEEERDKAFEELSLLLLDFTARGYFVQVMQREHHNRCYQKWLDTFQIERLYQEVSQEAREICDYIQHKRSIRLEKLAEEQKVLQQAEIKYQEEKDRLQQLQAQQLGERISLLSLIFGVPAIVIGFLGINLKGLTTDQGIGLRKALGLALGGLIIGWILSLFIARHTRSVRAKHNQA